MEPLPPLPPCDGPKLGPFAQNFEDLTFEPELVLKDQDLFVHSVVIKAKLNGETYGIKFFIRRSHFFNPKNYPDLTDDEIALANIQSDPFHAECRAYGRLKEAGEEHLAAKAYGYVKVFLNKTTEEMFKPVFEFHKTDDNMMMLFEHWESDPNSARDIIRRPESEPIYGIVKEWAGGDKRYDYEHNMTQPAEEALANSLRLIQTLPDALENLEGLHRNGIVIRDVHDGQWVEGKLVDLSCSWTFPHVLGQGDRHRPDWSFASYAAWDLYAFQDMIDSDNAYLDRMASHYPQKDTLLSSKKLKIVAYPKPEAPAKRVNREGLRPLPHRCEPQQRPLLQYAERYDPDSTERGPNFVPWTYGPRYDPTHYVPPKKREEAARQLAKTRAKSSRKPSRRSHGTKGKGKGTANVSKVSKTARKVARKV